MKQPYSTLKLLHHPEALTAMKAGAHQSPIQVHFMPMLACNQHCYFCSYGHRTPTDDAAQRGWKNMELMSDAFIPKDKMFELIEDWQQLGVKAVELTGGGEPLLHPQIDLWLDEVACWKVDLGLVTNGTALTPARAQRFGRTKWKWARVSIDAGSAADYKATRRVPESHWHKALGAVRLLADLKSNDEQRVGVGFVVDTYNWEDVYGGISKAKAHGADNIRVSFAFTPQGLARIPQEAIAKVEDQIKHAIADFQEDGKFQVNALFTERVNNVRAAVQDYHYCAAKEVIVVVGGDCNAYTCCTLAFNKTGLIGSFRTRRFKELWESPEVVSMFAAHNPREHCKLECLYEKRNKATLAMMHATPDELSKLRDMDQSIHRNFI